MRNVCTAFQVGRRRLIDVIHALAPHPSRASARMEVITDAPREIHTIFSAYPSGTMQTEVTMTGSTSYTQVGEKSVSRRVSMHDVFAELAPEESTLEVRSEGNWQEFAPAVDQGTLVGTITITPQEDDVSATFSIAPAVPRVDYFVGIAGVTPGSPGSRTAKAPAPEIALDFMPVPRFTPMEHVIHKTIFARLLAKRVAHISLRRVLPRVAAELAMKNVCECAGRFLPSVYRVENEAFEMMMLRRVKKHVDTVNVEEWNQKYMGPGKCVWPVRDFATEQNMMKMGFPPAPACDVRLVSGFKEHISCVETAVQKAKHSISITTCYFKADERHFIRLLTELLPAAAHRGVRVRMLLDATVARAAIARSNGWGPLTKYASQADARGKFLKFYDSDLQSVIDACPPGSFRVAFFQATEPEAGYEVKSHVKLFCVDGDFAVTGGSNLYPTELTQKSDCDIAVNGAAAKSIEGLFNEMWFEQTGEKLEACAQERGRFKFDAVEEAEPSPSVSDEPASDISVAVASLVPTPAPIKRVNLMSPLGWHAHGVRFHPVLSRPDAAGEDAVLRAIVGLIDESKREFLLCMGFAAPHVPLIDALRRATLRGVRVRILLNSQYSADLQTPMGDLALGARALLVAAPKVELYLTGPKSSEDPNIGKGVHAFQHGKFCVADRRLCSVGSWNAWARSAFHEMELNVLFDAPDLAEKLAEKWARAAASCARVKDPTSLVPGIGRFAPKGCEMCAPFGKFCENALAIANAWNAESCSPCEINVEGDL